VLGPRPVARSVPAPDDVGRVVALLEQAERPIVLVGATLAGDAALADLTRFSEAWSVPVCPTHRRPHLFDSTHPHYGGYVGNRVPAAQIKQLKEADLILAIGERLTDSVSQGYSFPSAPVPQQTLIHVWPDPVEVGRVWQPALGIGCDPHGFIQALLAMKPATPPAGRRDWIGRLNAVHRELTTWHPVSSNDGVVFGAVVSAIKGHLAPDAVVTADAGNFTTWIHRYLYFKQTNLFIGAAVGAMGAGVPSVVAAGLRRPGTQLVGFVGDGGFLMTGNELATALQYDVPVKIFICNNGSYGTIRMHQELRFPGRVTATALRNPDFAAMARAFGALGLTIENDADVERVVAEAMAADRPVVVDVRASLNHLTAWRRLDEMPAYAGGPGAGRRG
jgi:acetolactate synthase-1/2/3 large subunit